MGRTLLMTGHPHCGKTTVIRRIVASLGAEADGFYTEEILGPGGRQGFEIVTLGGQRCILAHKQLRSPKTPKVGRYGVDVKTFEKLGVQALRIAQATGKIVIVDEIGKMELLSPHFRSFVLELILGPSIVIGTIVYKPYPYADVFKSLANVTLWEVNDRNRDLLPQQALEWLAQNRKA